MDSVIKSFESQDKNIVSVVITPDGKYITSVSGENIIRIWDFSTNELVRTQEIHSDLIYAVEISSGGYNIVGFLEDEKEERVYIKIWDLLTGEEINSIENLKCRSEASAISPSNKYIIGGDYNGLIELYELSTGKITCSFKAHESCIISLAVSYNDRFIISGSDDNTIKIWEIPTQKLVRMIQVSDFQGQINISPNMKFIVGLVKEMIDTDKDLVKDEIEIDNGEIKFNKDFYSQYPRLYENILFARIQKKLQNKPPAKSTSTTETISLWNFKTGSRFLTLKGKEKYIYSLIISPDNKYIISSADDKTIKIWNALTGKLVRNMNLDSAVQALTISRDNKYIIGGLSNGSIKVWDFIEGRKEKEKEIKQKQVLEKKEVDVREDLKKNAALLIKNYSSIYTDITFEKLASKTRLEREEVERLIESMILNGDLSAQIKNNHLTFKQEIPKEKSHFRKDNSLALELDDVVKEKKKEILIFISYATKDAHIFQIKEIAEILTNYENISDVLYWQEDMHDNIITYMNDNLGKCDVILLFCSPNSLNSEPVKKEWTAAESLGKPIIPIFTKVEYIPYLLRSRLGIEFDPFNFKNFVEKLYNLIIKKIRE